MNNRIALCFMATLVVCGCQVKEMDEFVPDSVMEAKVFTAITEDGSSLETKTSLDNNRNVLWKLGDQVSVFAGSTINEQYQVSDESDGNTAATLNKITNSGFTAGTDIDNNVAFYPYTTTASIAKDGNSYVISDIALPATQNYVEASFGNGAFPMAAVTPSTEDMNLKFKNILGGLKLQLKGTATIASISITGNDNEILCGASEVNVANGSIPSISLSDATANTVTLDCGNGVQLNAETATVFIIALPPMTMDGGFTVVVTDTNGATMEIKTTKPQTINRSRLLKMPVVNYLGIVSKVVPEGAVDLGLSVMWASCNLCESGFVSSPEEYGDYYAWGETEPYYNIGHAQDNPCNDWKDNYSVGYKWASYSFCDGSATTLTKYNNDSEYGIVDNKTTFSDYLYNDDAARQILGNRWHIPTREEWTELYRECSWIWTTVNGVNGILITGPNNNNIFLPAGGRRYNSVFDDVYNIGSYGFYWSSTIYSTPYQAWRFNFSSSDFRGYSESRCVGLTIRPVTE